MNANGLRCLGLWILLGLSPAAVAQQPADNAAPAKPTTAAPAAHEAPTAADAAQQPKLIVEDLRPGIGQAAQAGMNLVVHYTGWLYQADALGYRGKKFDSSKDRGQPLTFTLGAGQVIKGWDDGLVGMKVGGLRRLVIPPQLAYGDRNVDNGLIPPNSTLVFEVELLGIESSQLKENVR